MILSSNKLPDNANAPSSWTMLEKQDSKEQTYYFKNPYYIWETLNLFLIVNKTPKCYDMVFKKERH